MILFTSDFHIQKGIWIDITINYLNYIINFCNENNIKEILIGGDVFEKATKIHNEAFVPLFMKFMEMKERGFKLYFILGNHDIFNDGNDSIIETFSPFGKVIKDSETITIDGYSYDCLSYTKDKNKIPNKSDVLLTHLSITDFSFDNNYTAEKNDFEPEDFSHYKLVITGHFHRHQEKYNIVYPGSPYEKNFGEEGQEKGFVVIDKNKFVFHPYNHAPKHLTINVEDFDKYDYKNKFVAVKISKKVENFVKLRHLLYTRGALEVKPIFEKEEEFKLDEIKVSSNGNITSIITEYLNEFKMEGIDNKKLINMFNTIVEEVK